MHTKIEFYDFKIMRSFIFSCLLLFSSALAAETFEQPEAIDFNSERFVLSSAYKIGQRVFYNYFIDGENKDYWTRKVTLQYAPNFKLTGAAWAKDVRAYLENSNSKPYYDIGANNGIPVVRYFAPAAAGFESHALRFFEHSCGGQVVFEYTVTDESQNPMAALGENKRLLNTVLDQLDWVPECGNT